MKFDVDESVVPEQDKFRHIPYNIRDSIESEIEDMLRQDIIERVDLTEPTPWLSQIVPIRKPNNRVRICVDAKKWKGATFY